MSGFEDGLPGVARGHLDEIACVVYPGNAAPHKGAQLASVLDPANTASGVCADTDYCLAANIEMRDTGA